MQRSIEHLPSWLQSALSASGPTRLEFPGAGYVTVFPAQERYASNIGDWAMPALLGLALVKVTPLSDGSAAPDSQPLNQLLWTLTLQCVRNRAQDCAYQVSLVRLVSWPSLTHLPEDVRPTVARLCALLARKPTTASLLPRSLGLEDAHVYPLLEALRLHGHVHACCAAAAVNPGARLAEAPTATETMPADPSLIGKLWQRLISRP